MRGSEGQGGGGVGEKGGGGGGFRSGSVPRQVPAASFHLRRRERNGQDLFKIFSNTAALVTPD